MMDKNYVKKFKSIASHVGMNIGDPYTFIDDVEVELADLLENALDNEEQAIKVLEDQQEGFEIPFSIKRAFNNHDYLVIHGSIIKDQKKCGNKAFPYFSNSYSKIDFIKNGNYTERKFIYKD